MSIHIVLNGDTMKTSSVLILLLLISVTSCGEMNLQPQRKLTSQEDSSNITDSTENNNSETYVSVDTYSEYSNDEQDDSASSDTVSNSDEVASNEDTSTSSSESESSDNSDDSSSEDIGDFVVSDDLIINIFGDLSFNKAKISDSELKIGVNYSNSYYKSRSLEFLTEDNLINCYANKTILGVSRDYELNITRVTSLRFVSSSESIYLTFDLGTYSSSKTSLSSKVSTLNYVVCTLDPNDNAQETNERNNIIKIYPNGVVLSLIVD